MRDVARAPLRAAWLLGAVAALLLMVAWPGAALASGSRPQSIDRITIADAPPGGGEDCVDDPDAHPGVGLQKCPTPFTIATLLPFVAGGAAVVLAVVIGWYLVMRRRASKPFLPDEAFEEGAGAGDVGPGRTARGLAATAARTGEWWTCSNCGATNMVGSARCYSCGSWQR